MKSILLIICTFIITGGLSGCNNTKNLTDVTDKNPPGDTTSIYLVAMAETALHNSLDTPLIGCDDKLVEVIINKKLSPQETLEKLFAYKEYSEEEGIYNVFALSDNLKVEEITVANNFAIVKLSEGLITSDMCDNPRVYAQIAKTLTQFDTIAGVDIYVGDREVNTYLSEKDIPEPGIE